MVDIQCLHVLLHTILPLIVISYLIILQWVASSRKEKSVLEAMWKMMCDMQTNIIHLLDSENDGVRTQVCIALGLF